MDADPHEAVSHEAEAGAGATGTTQADRDADWTRRQARAEQFAHRFVGLTEADALTLADELDLTVRFFRRGDRLTEDDCAGRVSAGVEDGVVFSASALY